MRSASSKAKEKCIIDWLASVRCSTFRSQVESRHSAEIGDDSNSGRM